MKKLGIGALLFLLMAVPTAVLAQSASKDFPNDKAGGNNVGGGDAGTMGIRAVLKLPTTPPVKVQMIQLTGPLAGDIVAARGSNALCNAAIADTYNCNGIVGIAACSGGSCCAANPNEFQSVICVIGDVGLSISRNQSDFKFTVGPIGAGQGVNALNHNTNAGNTVHTDPLPQYLVRVDRNGVDGNVGFSVTHTQGGANPRTFSLLTTGLNDLEFHQAIRAGFEGLGLGLKAIVHSAAQASSHSWAPESINGYFVRIVNAQAMGVQDIGVSPLEGQNAIVETNVPGAKPPVPMMSTFGLALLTFVLAVTGAWILRRRRREIET